MAAALIVLAACGDASTTTLGGGPGSSSSGDGMGDDADGGSGTTSPGQDGGSTPKDGGGGGTGPSSGSDKPSCKYTPHKTGLTSLQQAGGLSFHTYVPSSYDKNIGHAVVIIMHGQDSNGVAEVQGLWQSIADQDGLGLIAPKGSRAPTNGSPTGGNWAVADLNKVQDIITDVDDCYNVLTKKRILWGFSAGTFYGYLLGIGATGLFSGLAMAGANTSFARQNGFEPASATWKIPVSHVHGTGDFNPISFTYQDRTDFQAAGHVFTLHEHAGGHSITPAQVKLQYDDLKTSISP